MRVILVTLLCLVAIGCNADPHCRRETALLRAEYLDLEDKYYQLKAKHESSKCEPYCGEGQIIYQGDAGTDDIIYEGEVIYETPSNGDAPSESSESSSVLQPSAAQSDDRGVESFNELEISLPEEQSAPSDVHELPEPPIDGNVPQSNLKLNSPVVDVVSSRALRSTFEITDVVINRNASRGHDVDGILGDEGINLLIQPRTSDGRVVLQPGELTVSVIDPRVSPARQRVGLWKFLPAETELFFVNDEIGSRGILLHLPWDQSIPTNKKLDVHVRFITQDGRTLKTSTELRIEPPSPKYSANDPRVIGWTLRDPRWSANSTRVPETTNRNRDWRPRVRSGAEQSTGRSIPTVEATSEIEKPRWRPIR